MRKQDRIISLIQSLLRGEKKYFMQRSKAGDKDKSYLKLYELLSRENGNTSILHYLPNKNLILRKYFHYINSLTQQMRL